MKRILLFFSFIFSVININTQNNKDLTINNTTDYENIMNNLTLLNTKKQFNKIIEICKTILSNENIETKFKVEILEILANTYFSKGENKRAIELYKNILNNYKEIENKNNILFNMCCAIYKLMPKRPEVDLDYCHKLINHGIYSLEYIDNKEQIKNIENMMSEAYNLIETKEINDIKFFLDNNKYDSYIYLCDIFFNNYPDSEYYDNVLNIKGLSFYYNIIRYLNTIKKLKTNKSINLNIFKEIYDKIVDNYDRLEQLSSEKKISSNTLSTINQNIELIKSKFREY